jgi:hypothetical protein
MSIFDIAEARVATKGFKRHWGRTTSTAIEDEQPDISISSEAAPQNAASRHLFIAWMPQNMFEAAPPSLGKVLVFEGAPEQVAVFGTGVASSHVIPDFIDPSGLISLLGTPHCRAALPSRGYEDEVLNWDVAIQVAPKRPSGTLAVTLKYAGRGLPIDIPAFKTVKKK